MDLAHDAPGPAPAQGQGLTCGARDIVSLLHAASTVHKGLPSLTAVLVASARALASSAPVASCDPGDRAARAVLPRVVGRGLQLLDDIGPATAFLPRALALASLGMIDHLALRTRAIDSALSTAIERGIDQVVILGAGLDTRAHRMHELRNAHVFEVDHPNGQRQKRANAAAVPVLAAALTYVPVDFSRDSLGSALSRHGHDASRPTFWIWEGVVPYLDASAVVETLRTLHEHSAQYSELALTYVPSTLGALKYARPAITLGMRVIGEPLRFVVDREELARVLTQTAFDLVSDTDTRDWRDQHGQRSKLGLDVAYERLALARPR
jgi:methyltransferase (TIGR00027 family)